MRPAVFLDRDGTLIEELGFLSRIEDATLFPWSAEAVRRLNRAGFAVIVVTNQSGIARGLFDEAFVDAVHCALDARLAMSGARIDAYYVCPHHPEAAIDRYRTVCDCRKPQPGMLRQAAAELGIDLRQSWIVGDQWRDIEAGTAAGAKGILVRTGYGAQHAADPLQGAEADAILSNLMEAAEWILRSSTSR